MPLACGASVVTISRFLPRQVLETIADRGVSVVIGSPFIFKAFARFLSANRDSGPDLGEVRAWVSSGAALPPAMDRSLAGLGLPVRQLYGSSETGTLCLSGPGPLEPGCVGQPVPGVEIRLVGAGGEAVASGEAGAIEVRSPALFDGYIADVSGRPARGGAGFYAMGDLGRWNDRGELMLQGRSDAMINVAGVKVDPREVQAVLESMPEIAQALVHGRPDADGMQQIRALIVARHEIRAEEVLAYCRSRLAEYKLPRFLEFVDEIPQDLMGKTARRLLET
jgi:long-chain acyl-CoA synthetase